MTSNVPLSPIVLSTLREIMGHPYHLSRDAIIYSEVVTGELNYGGIHEKPIALNVVKGFHVEKLQFQCRAKTIRRDGQLPRQDGLLR